jgi:chemotaxis receptor (MCP) glutamine deamidase CheD
VTFRQLNFISDNWPLKVKFDFIMCRNASIYFDLPTQQKLFTRLLNQTIPRGWIFVGHAEVLHWLNERIEGFQGGIYRSKATGSSASGLRPMPPLAHPVLTLPAATLPPPAPVPSAPRPPRPSAVPLPRPSARVRSPGEAENLEVVNINAGEAHSSDSPVEIKTVLGSCVAACLYDPVAKIGGMNHFLLPSSGSDDPIDRQRFGIHAMETLINSLMKLGADRSRLKGKLFGGGNVLTNITRRPTVGEMNAEFAENFLRTEGIPVTASRLGGETGVEVRFHPHTGRAFLRDISRGSVELKDEEKSISAPKLAAGDAELF